MAESTSVNAKLFVGSIPTNVSEEELKEELSKYGQLVSLFYMPDQMKQNNGWAFVTFESNQSASNAIDALNGKIVFESSNVGLEVVYASQRSMVENQTSTPAVSVLWQQFTTAEGVPYYYNVRTGQTQWEKPAELMAPARAVAGGSSFGPPGANLFVFHVPANWNDLDLVEHFKHFGNVISARVQRDSAGRNRGFGFISYDNPQSAVVAIKNMNGFSVGGKYLKVQLKKGEEHYMQMEPIQSHYPQHTYGTQINNSNGNTLTPKYQMHYNPY
uniref:RNA recognition motif. (A.k.a. RRM, RBD, or RNP domain)/RNA recognition motif (A.k.a. RRM, RBD, or RNP domain)/WW domain containing protein, putative n=1 Tax=Theileria annulata TaxID=5874 RepID=A0A3B0N673_THEAN